MSTNPRSRPRILVAEPERFDESALQLLSEVGNVDRKRISQGDVRQALLQYDAIWIRLGLQIRQSMIPEFPRCRLISCPATGLDHVDVDACEAVGIDLVSLKGEVEFLNHVRATAELTVGLALALLRKVPQAAHSVLQGKWDRDSFQGRELYGRTAGIVGLGRLGKIVASYLNSFGMQVIGVDPAVPAHGGVEMFDSLEALVAVADLVTVHVPLSVSTQDLISRSIIGLMKSDAILINTSRGGVVDEEALLAALECGQLAGAALDVVASEPEVSADHPLVGYARAHDNLLIVPHIGGNTMESWKKTERFIARKVVEQLRASERRPERKAHEP